MSQAKEEMKNIPKVIYLQLTKEDAECEDFNELSQVSWCEDCINETDIKYVLESTLTDNKGEETKPRLYTEDDLIAFMRWLQNSEWDYNGENMFVNMDYTEEYSLVQLMKEFIKQLNK